MKNEITKNDTQETIVSQRNGDENSFEENLWSIHLSKHKEKIKSESICPEDYIYQPDYMHHDLIEADSFMTLDDFPDEFYFGSEMLFEELINELNKQMSGNIEYDKRITTRINLLDKAGNYFSGPELLAIDFCISSYASICHSDERKNEIKRTLFLLEEELKTHEIDTESFSKKMDSFNTSELFELTEILLNSKIIRGCIWEIEKISESQPENKSLKLLIAKLCEFTNGSDNKMSATDPSEPEKVETVCVSSKIIDYIKDAPDFRTRIDDFNKPETLYLDFSQSFGFHLRRSLLMYQSAQEKMRFNQYVENKGVINNKDTSPDAKAVKDILWDFIIVESQKVKNRATGYYTTNIRFDEKIHQFASIHDYSLIVSKGQIENYKSALFDKENWELIMDYYLEYIWYFPITIAEYEKTLFIFLLYATKKTYQTKIVVEEISQLQKELNKVLHSEHIEMNSEYILILFHIFSTDPYLRKMRDELFDLFKKIIDLLMKQAFSNY